MLALNLQMEELECEREKSEVKEKFSSQRENLMDFLSKASAYEIEDVDASGDCLFDALAHQLIRARNAEHKKVSFTSLSKYLNVPGNPF
jgi:hypothetical protein